MSLSFGANNAVIFSNLGSTATGLKSFFYDQGSGGSFVLQQTPVNWVSGSAMAGTIQGVSFQSFTNNTLSLTTSSTRVVECSLIPVTSARSYATIINTVGVTNGTGAVRVIRGPSQVIASFGCGSQDGNPRTWEIPASSFLFRDLSPIDGAATYIIEATTDGLSVGFGWVNAAFFVRQT